MKFIIVLSIALLNISSQEQDVQLLINSWTQGKKEASGKIVQADASRGGWYMLKLNADSTMIFNDPFSCGFGFEKQGTWHMQSDSVIRFVFTKKVGYMNNKGVTEINETELYKIIRLEKNALILEQLAGEKPRILIFTAIK
jgi:hypothetical protein